MAIGNLSVNDYFQELKSKVDRLTNLGSKVSDESLVTYAINGSRSKFLEIAQSIRHREKLPTFDEARSIILLEEWDWHTQQQTPNVFHSTSSSPTVLIATPTPEPVSKDNTLKSSGIELSRNFQRGSCTYGARCKFVHGANDFRPRPTSTLTTSNNRSNLSTQPRPSQTANTKPVVQNPLGHNAPSPMAHAMPLLHGPTH
ncbi:Toll/interleukin-1 receptor domain-containing protein [Tanacetum coccineum]